MITIRPLNYALDRSALASLDTSFTSNQMYRIVGNDLTFELHEERVDPPIYKDYRLAQDLDDLEDISFAVVAEESNSILGLTAVKFEVWNKRAVIWHLYVAPPARKRGIGKALIDHCLQYAKKSSARCLWLETQNINFPAIQFYRKMKFEFCGLDTTLYDPAQVESHEVALFFVRQIE